jgi:large subunit ribosomal protein L13
MLPGGPLGRDLIKKLKVYADDKHPHKAQNPVTLEV